MDKRDTLHHSLIKLLGTSYAYFQPPPSLKLNYPCIVYGRTGLDISYADNSNYKQRTKYQITVIDRSPDSPLVDKVAKLPFAKFVTHFNKDNLNHDVFTIYY